MNKSFLWFLLPTLLQTVLGVCVMVPITTYYLDPADFGTFAILTAIAMLVTPLSSTGDNWVLSSHWHATSELGRKELLFNLLAANLSMKAVWIAIFWVGSPFVLPSLVRDYRPEYHLYFGLALLGSLAGTFWSTLSSLMVIERASVSHAFNESLQWGTGALTTLVGLSVVKIGVVALFVAPIAAGLISMLHGFSYVARKLSVKFSRHWFKEIIRTGLPAIPFSMMDVVANTLDRFVIQRWLDLTTLGIYAHSQSYRGMFLTVTKAYARTMTPTFLELYAGQSKEPPRRVEETVSLWYLCVTAGGILVTLFSPEVVHLLTHGKFDQAAGLVPVWYLLVFIHSLGIPYTQYLLTIRENLLLSWTSIPMSVVTMGMVCIGTWLFGVLGATSAAVIGAVVLHGSRWYLARRFGCPDRLETGCLWGMATVITVYLVTYYVEVPLAAKIILGGMVVVALWFRVAPLVSWQTVMRGWVESK